MENENGDKTTSSGLWNAGIVAGKIACGAAVGFVAGPVALGTLGFTYENG